jgi:hypothetical protein
MHGGRSHRRPRLEMGAQTDAPNEIAEALGMTVKRNWRRLLEAESRLTSLLVELGVQQSRRHRGATTAAAATFAPTYNSRSYR